VDDHALVREGLRRLIEHDPGLEVAAEAGSAEEALGAAHRCKPDMCILDVSLPGVSGIDFAKQLLMAYPECRILMLSVYDETVYAVRAFRAGARGYVMKHEKPDAIADAIRKVARGEYHLSLGLQQLSVQTLSGTSANKPSDFTNALTDRELEILRLIGQGHSAAEIAKHLHRSVKTVDAHRQALKQKLGVHSTSNLTTFAAQWVQKHEAFPHRDGTTGPAEAS
jgi:DNA-binding NarL/FixJ family response regulator